MKSSLMVNGFGSFDVPIAVASVMYFLLEKPAMAAVKTKWAASKVYDHLT